jgi:hypothetical protein
VFLKPPELGVVWSPVAPGDVGVDRASGFFVVLVVRVVLVRGTSGTDVPWRGVPLPLLDVPVHTRCEADLVQALAAAGADVLATIPAGDEVTAALLQDPL